jgi:hypothetical protein
MENRKTSDNLSAFGMTSVEIIAAADALSKQKDTNHPTESGSYPDFIKTLKAGRQALRNQQEAR